MKQLIYIYTIFFVDSFLENFWRIYQWFKNVTLSYDDAIDMYNVSGSYRNWIPWIILITIHKFLPFDFFDRMIIVLLLFFSVIDTADWYWSYNQRDDYIDWAVFVLFSVVLIGLKFYFKKKPTDNSGML